MHPTHSFKSHFLEINSTVTSGFSKIVYRITPGPDPSGPAYGVVAYLSMTDNRTREVRKQLLALYDFLMLLYRLNVDGKARRAGLHPLPNKKAVQWAKNAVVLWRVGTNTF